MSKSVFTKGFNALLVTQFLGAVNDNLLKQIFILQVAVGGVWAAQLGDGGQGLVTTLFAFPFLLLSGWSGQFADKHSKQKVSQWVKIAEIPIVGLAALALGLGQFALGMGALLLLGLHSTVFGPAKYGMLPELFPRDLLGRANGVINMFTNIAIIAGIVIGASLSANYPGNTAQIGAVMLTVAVLGLLASRLLKPLEPTDPSLRYARQPLGPYWDALSIMVRDRALILLCLGGGFFYLVAVMAVDSIPDFRVAGYLDISDEKVGYLTATLAIGIGVGSTAAGYLMGDGVRSLWLVLAGAVGMTGVLMCTGLGDFRTGGETTGFGDPAYDKMAVLLAALGAFGGCYIVPFQALVQACAPESQHGRILGTYNAMTFVFIAAAGGIYYLLRKGLEMSVQHAHLVLAMLVLDFTLILLLFLRDALRRREQLRAAGSAPVKAETQDEAPDEANAAKPA